MADEWITAGGIVVVMLVAGAVAGHYLFGSPLIGAAVGVAGGMAINWQRNCPVCMAHAAEVRRAMGART